MLVCIAERCQSELDSLPSEIRRQVAGLVDRIREIDDKTGATALSAEFELHRPYLKRRIANHRLIAQVRTMDGTPVLCLLACLARAGHDYRQFTRNPHDWGRRRLDTRISEADLRIVASAADASDPIPRLQVPPEYRAWFDPPHEAIPGDLEGQQVFESPYWVGRILLPGFRAHLETFLGLVQDAADGAGTSLPSREDVYLLQASNSERTIIFSRPISSGGTQHLLLIAPFLTTPSESEIGRVVQQALQRPVPSASTLALEDLRRISRRTYPAYVLAGDLQVWKPIESDDVANLALSAEERDLLYVTATGVGRPLPLFLNGRAGSGKTTMLLYLFSAYCRRKIDKALPGHPVLLSYSERLVDTARASVRGLLSVGWQTSVQNQRHEQLDEVGSWLQPFRSFLRAGLGHEAQHFDEGRRVGFYEFKRAFHGGESGRLPPLRLRSASRWSPEICWYVIRCLIEGFLPDRYLSPEDYARVDRAEHVVPDEVFAEIHETIWTKWYRPAIEERDLWDDQRLVAAAIAAQDAERSAGPDSDADRTERPNGPVVDRRSEITAIFCDEAQDFTRRELQFLLRTSVLTRYDLTAWETLPLPFVLAGDPMQTLNPTGFRWPAVSAAVRAELERRVGVALTVQARELRTNYRSSPKIVNVSNHVQLWRRVLFGHDDVSPQTTWAATEGSAPRKFIIGATSEYFDEAELLRKIEDTILLVPCEEGGERSFASDDPLLRRLVTAGDALPPRNVLSAATAKGAEFHRVVLYKFGEHAPDSLWDVRTLGPAARFEADYFFNKLYVAASRAKQELFVIDTINGDRKLWSRLETPEVLRHESLDEEARSAWRGSVAGISAAGAGEEGVLREDDPAEIARELRSVGNNNQNPQVLRQAADYYRRTAVALPDAELLADLCEAEALEIEGAWVGAGEIFQQCGDWDRAWKCYWRGSSWPELKRWFDAAPGTAQARRSAERCLVSFMESARRAEDLVDFAVAIEALLNDRGDVALPPSSAQWHEGVNALGKEAAGARHVLSEAQMMQIAGVLHPLALRGFAEAAGPAGRLFFGAGAYEPAVKCWMLAGESNHREYALARCEIDGVPMGLRWLAELRLHDDILERWEATGKPAGRGWADYVVGALEASDRVEEAVALCLRAGEWRKAVELYRRHPAHLEALQRRDLYELSHGLGTLAELNDALWLIANGAPTDFQRRVARAEVVDGLVRAALGEGLPNPPRRRVVMALADELDERLLDPAVQGAFLELFGRRAEARRHYERLLSRRERDSRKRAYFQERWVVLKRQQIARMRGDGNLDRAAELEAELNDRCTSWGIPGDRDIPVQPILPPGVRRPRERARLERGRSTPAKETRTGRRRAAPAAPDDTQEPRASVADTTSVGDVEIVRRPGVAVLILHAGDMATATVLVHAREVQSALETHEAGAGETPMYVLGAGYEFTVSFEPNGADVTILHEGTALETVHVPA